MEFSIENGKIKKGFSNENGPRALHSGSFVLEGKWVQIVK